MQPEFGKTSCLGVIAEKTAISASLLSATSMPATALQLTQTVTRTLTANPKLIVHSSIIGLLSQFVLLLKRTKKFATNMRSAQSPISAGTLLLRKWLLERNDAWNSTVRMTEQSLDGKMLTAHQQLPIFRIIHTMESIA